jgi:hypothetical protein
MLRRAQTRLDAKRQVGDRNEMQLVILSRVDVVLGAPTLIT